MCELLDKYENRGRDSALTEALQALMLNMNLTIDKAMEALNVPENRRSYYMRKVQGRKRKGGGRYV